MGEVSTAAADTNNNTLTKKKKKGRPSLLDLQKRAIKQQQQQLLLQRTNPDVKKEEEEFRSSFRNPNSGGAARLIRRNSNSGDEEDDDERRDKKHRLLHGLNSHDSSSDFKSDGGGVFNTDASITRRYGSDDNTGEKASKATHILLRGGSLVESYGPSSTPLPDKKLLLFILDRVQKKDTYGVYSDPVDTEELPDYHEIIKNPMDFSTLRKKLESGAYSTLEQFEQDVILICTNAMEYNSADTVYFRQARAMLELAKKDFGNLRQESDGEEQVSHSQQPKVVKRGRPPGSGLKKQLDQSLIDRSTTSEISADAAGDSSRLSGSYNLRKNPPSYGFRQAESCVRINHSNENQNGFLIDWDKEFPPSVVKAVNKYGMKNVDENRRDTYNQISTSLQDASIFTMLEDDLKQLTPVGLRTEYGYARSLARYAANLGPVAWRYADKRIQTMLPTGTEFGPGWVGENPEAPPESTPQQQILMSGKQKCSSDFASDDHRHPSRIMSPTTSVSSSIIGNKHSSHESKDSEPAAHVLNQETKSNSLLVHGFSGFNHKPNQMVETDVSQQGLSPNVKQEFQQLPPDLNARLVSPNSPGSNNQAGSSQHPDLALQL
ncbi:PREDICTED: ankyrin repeat, bromo and BTB domain-containing protein DDB_G0293800-like [Camelina sativa]|uniref:Ankyrin repeat, bromo and BTB domain-containing protein DDB_G0293800-like n=1 Tax=Camelina sativa TaxID=90675 RepID=A0ABM0SV24_CAMSA|nr:PREDICTED: ankyrin repeat, bromo and BTB domain-containing protein DDB_G0293800-like [Camelina sativa]